MVCRYPQHSTINPQPGVTVKWRGKSAPAAWRHAGLLNPIGSKTRSGGDEAARIPGLRPSDIQVLYIHIVSGGR